MAQEVAKVVYGELTSYTFKKATILTFLVDDVTEIIQIGLGYHQAYQR